MEECNTDLWVHREQHCRCLVTLGIIIRKYSSTFYIGIAMVVLPYFGPWEN